MKLYFSSMGENEEGGKLEEKSRDIQLKTTQVWACPKREIQHRASQRTYTARYSQMDIPWDPGTPRITV